MEIEARGVFDIVNVPAEPGTESLSLSLDGGLRVDTYGKVF